MTTVYFVRHGEYDGQNEFVAFRAKGFPLSKKGQKQILGLARTFKNDPVAAIFTSPLRRCLETAKVIGGQLAVKPVEDERLLEVRSPYNGIKKKKLLEIKGKNSLYELPRQIAEGETVEEVEERMKNFLKEALRVFKDKTLIVVSHADPIMILKYDLEGRDFSKRPHVDPHEIGEGQAFKFVFQGFKLKG